MLGTATCGTELSPAALAPPTPSQGKEARVRHQDLQCHLLVIEGQCSQPRRRHQHPQCECHPQSCLVWRPGPQAHWSESVQPVTPRRGQTWSGRGQTGATAGTDVDRPLGPGHCSYCGLPTPGPRMVCQLTLPSRWGKVGLRSVQPDADGVDTQTGRPHLSQATPFFSHHLGRLAVVGGLGD